MMIAVETLSMETKAKAMTMMPMRNGTAGRCTPWEPGRTD